MDPDVREAGGDYQHHPAANRLLPLEVEIPTKQSTICSRPLSEGPPYAYVDAFAYAVDALLTLLMLLLTLLLLLLML